ncbi:hypothetical protein BO78DRAFT_453527 [Aspergillus sclerotiicarbonarius CBS 121057]|uniref:HNH nuclease domain-containing protein n=1 Tax=Aspergillus sclerotiicarbonarius (strain CBS 121057 / IBT 28362) TaxID=1448318 RepID=A0A319DY16_ASPSB|nr:hypothetical protein BO78DRAFT_453527 [Aspergillus sclerotiicarbonarius CBS 121057]
MGPAEELADTQRCQLIDELANLVDNTPVNSATWACLWFGDIERIRELVHVLKLNKDVEDIVHTSVTSYLRSDSATNMLKAWAMLYDPETSENLDHKGDDKEDDTKFKEATSRKRRRDASRSRSPSKIPRLTCGNMSDTLAQEETENILLPDINTGSTTKATSSSDDDCEETAERLCCERDQKACLLTGFREPLEIGYICPFSFDQHKETDNLFWKTQHFFWSKERVNAWKQEVLGPNGTQVCSNSVCFVNLALSLWENARFALRPLALSEDRKRLTVEFHWLPAHAYRRSRLINTRPDAFPINLSSYIVGGKDAAMLFDIHTKSELRSGDKLTFLTSDPDGHPLPSMELLQMQWILNRVLALSGVAEPRYK